MSPIVILAVLLVTGLGSAVMGALALGLYFGWRWSQPAIPERRCPRIGHWLRPPRVLIHESCPVDPVYVETAMSWWRAKGYAFQGMYPEVTDLGDRESIRGCILVVGPGFRQSVAMTRLGTSRWRDPVEWEQVKSSDYYTRVQDIVSLYADGQIEHAVIDVPKPTARLNMDLYLIHTFGEALGLAHIDAVPEGEPVPTERLQGHVLSCLLSEAGWNASGIPRGPYRS